MKLNHLLLGILAIIPIELSAQSYFVLRFDPETYQPEIKSFALVDSCIVSTSVMTVSYSFYNSADKWPRLRPIINMQISPTVIKQTDQWLLNVCHRHKGQEAYTLLPGYSTFSSNLFFEQIQNRKTGGMKITCGDFLKENRPKKYEDNPTMQWTLTEQTDTVAGYFCHTASTQFRGRTWEVWYTTEIPVQAGPWRLGGLPGLILKAADKAGVYKFECSQMQAVETPIYEYSFKRIQDLKTDEAYRKMERTFYEHPYHAYKANGDEITVILANNQNSTGPVKIINNDSWEIPYDPIAF